MEAQISKLRYDSAEQEVYLNLWRTYDRLRAYEDALFARFDLTPQQYNVLRLLKAEHPEPVATLTIAERLVSRAPDITRMLDKLEARKLISRQRSETDRRTVHIRITLNGIALLDQISEPLRECHNQQLGHLNKSQLKQLVELLKLARQPHEDSNNTWR
ncbi:MarR family transcriptional regulator [Telmatocola sphagniphila]|uniref:MarR family transcriptional regulator n=1 Tax=Telmatocola sphagniphila TaxID=1123043 RepID=A0A8E6F0G9_9BACT|nr:MarR family transcriptional regulator [Telmatocola sphagniphila]QVL34793.1 MarR family transcriptional regulator [Telmatocola sphagniphila]